MTAGAWTLTNAFRKELADGSFNVDSDSFKLALVTSASNIGASTTTFAGVTNELSTANGYTAGGVAVSLSSTGTTSVPVTMTSSPAWTASGGSITARTAVLYKVSGNVVGYFLLDNTPADVTVTSGNTLTVNNTNPIVTIA